MTMTVSCYIALSPEYAFQPTMSGLEDPDYDYGLAIGGDGASYTVITEGDRGTLTAQALSILDACMNPVVPSEDDLANYDVHPDDVPELRPDWTPDLPVIRVPGDDGPDRDTYWLSLRLPLTEATGVVEQAIAYITNLHDDMGDVYDALVARLRPWGIIPLPAVSTEATL